MSFASLIAELVLTVWIMKSAFDFNVVDLVDHLIHHCNDNFPYIAMLILIHTYESAYP